MENKFAYWLEIKKEVAPIKNKLIEMKEGGKIPDIILTTNNELELSFHHILNYKENYQEYLQRIFREVFYELFNMQSIPVKINEEKMNHNSISATITILIKEMEKELGEEIEINQIRGCMRSAFEKHFDYLDLIDYTLDQLLNGEEDAIRV